MKIETLKVQELKAQELRDVEGGQMRHVGSGVYETKDGYYYYGGRNGLIYFGVALHNAATYISKLF